MADFDAPKLMLVVLVRFDLPGHTIRLCDGGFVWFNGEKYTSTDQYFGSIMGIDDVTENSGDQAPGATVVFLPKSSAATAILSNPSYQGSSVRAWLARVDEETGVIAGTPELVADLLLDTTALKLGKNSRRLVMELMAVAERLFSINEGNVLSPRFHKDVWPDETGMDNATGVPLSVAWGVVGPARGTSFSGGGSGGGGGGFAGGVAASAVRLMNEREA